MPPERNELARPEIDFAIAAVRAGGLIVYPTETLYGLGADARSSAALDRLAALKGRDAGKPVSVLVSSRRLLLEIASSVPPLAEKLMDAFWPGPLTIVFPARSELSPVLTGGGATIAARISSHPIARAIVERLGRPLTSTSANPGGQTPPVEAGAARGYFGSRVEVYVDAGPTAGGPGSTVIDCTRDRPVLLREGTIGAAEIERTIGVRPERR